MWIFTVYGFYSVVDARRLRSSPSKDDPMVVRARVRKHLVALRDVCGHIPGVSEAAIVRTGGKDYLYRMPLRRDAAAACMAYLMEANIASNFKGACLQAVRDHNLDAKYEAALHRVWEIMYSIQPRGGCYDKPT
jgi:hypothetical protein